MLAVATSLWTVPALAAAAPAAAPPSPLPSLRHLVYNFSIGITDVVESHIEGNSSGGSYTDANASSAVNAGRTTKQSADTRRTGQIIIDVVAATADYGLVVDITQVSTDKNVPLTRVAIAADGTLGYNPNAGLTQEEAAILKLLGRNVIGSAQHTKGETWDIPQTANGYTEKMTYSVVDAPVPTTEVLALDGNFQQTGMHAIDGTETGKIVYNPTVSVPNSALLTTRIHAKDPGTYTTTDMVIDLNLVEDSFAKPKA
jgi:hypothetical protein